MPGKTKSFGGPPAAGGDLPALPATPIMGHDEVAEQVRQRVAQIPSLSGILEELVRLAQHPASGAPHFEKVIRQDPVLAGKLLQVANSTLYAREKDVKTITEAVVLLGLDQIRSLIFAATGSKLLAQKLEWYGYEGTGLWLHSIACAHAARFVAAAAGMNRRSAEQMYVAGLVHDVGKVMLGGALRELAPEFGAPLHVPHLGVTDIEEAHLSFSHAEAGDLIGRHWHLQAEQLAALRYHHDPASAGEHTWAAAIVHVADVVSARVGLGFAGRYRFRTELAPKAAAVLGLKPEVIVECGTALRRQADQLARIYAAFVG